MLHLVKNDYLMRHDRVDTHLNYSLCKALGNHTTEKWYMYTPKPVFEHKDVSVMETRDTYREVTENSQDVIN